MSTVGGHPHMNDRVGGELPEQRAPGQAAIRLPAEIDIANSADVGALLTAASLATSDDLVIDASALTFVDVSGARAIVQVANASRSNQFVRVTQAPDCLIRVLTICKWIDHPKLILLRQSGREATPQP
jgi:anti-anti-sigma regulatory factor